MNEGQQMRFTRDELVLMKSLYQNNEKALKMLRKVFLPELDMDAPIGQNFDLYMTLDVKEKSPEEVKIQVLARNQLIHHIEQQLGQLRVLADLDEKTAEQKASDAKKDSAK